MTIQPPPDTTFTGFNADGFVFAWNVRRQVYLTNDYDPIKRVDVARGIMVDAGLAAAPDFVGAPTLGVGALTAGAHLIRYRYLDAQTGWVSNPSANYAFVATGSNSLVFSIGGGGVITPSTDPRVSHIVLEMTLTDGTEFYEAIRVSNSAATVTVSVLDSILAQQRSISANWGGPDDEDSFRHNQPPLALFGFEHRGRHFVGGSEDRVFENITLTDTLYSVTGFGTAARDGWSGRSLQVVGESGVYTIHAATDGGDTLTLSDPFDGTTGAKTVRIFDPNATRIYWSLAGYPESFDTLSQGRDLLLSKGDVLRAGVSAGGDAYLFGRASTTRLSFVEDPGVLDGQEFIIPGNRGAINPKTVLDVYGVVYAWDQQGVWALSGDKPTPQSQAIDPILRSQIDWTKYQQFFMAFEPVTESILCFFCRSGDTYPTRAAALGVRTGQWCFYDFMTPVASAALVIHPEGVPRLCLGGADGRTWFAGAEGWFDGVEEDSPSILSVQEGATTTVIPVAEDASGLAAGLVVYHPSLQESVAISAAADGEVTITPAFSAAPVAGEELYVGPIRWMYRTKWIAGDVTTKKRPPYLFLQVDPSATGEVLVRFRTDYATGYSAYSRYVSDQTPDGVSITDGEDFAIVSLDAGNSDGFIPVPIPAAWKRAIQVELQGIKPAGVTQIIGFQIGTGEADNAPVRRE